MRAGNAVTPDGASAFDAVLARAVERPAGVPGVVAMLTDARATVYAGAAGVRESGTTAPMTTETVLAMFSCTKAITATAVMQLVEAGAIRLDEPARRYVPEIGDLPVLAGFDSAGAPILRASATDITIEQLLLHTAGFGYDMFDAELAAYTARNSAKGRIPALMSVLRFDPGTNWRYGVNLDWAGRVVEAVRGEPLAAVMRKHIFEPLEMHDTGYLLTAGMRERRAALHQRAADGTLSVLPAGEPPQSPKAQTGGSGLFSTADDYLKFIRMILNDGATPGGAHVVAARTVAIMAENHLSPLAVCPLPGALPLLSNPVDFFPETPKSWGYSWMITDRAADTGRPAGTFGWAGLANLFYWIDRRTGIGGFWGTQVLPFIDPASVQGYLEFETAAYAHRNGPPTTAGLGSNA